MGRRETFNKSIQLLLVFPPRLWHFPNVQLTRFLCLSLLVCFVPTRAAAPPRWGVSAGAHLHSNCTAGAGCRGDALDVSHSVWRSYDSLVTVESDADYGKARVTMELTGTNQALFPKISGIADSIGPNVHWNYALGIVMEGYRYNGPTTGEVEFNVTLSGTSNATQNGEGLDAKVYLFKEEGFVYVPHLPTLLGETTAQPITNATLRISLFNNGATLTNKLSVLMQPGEMVYLYAELALSVYRAGGKAISPDGLQISSPQKDFLTSESLIRTPPELTLISKTNSLSLSIPPSRRPMTIQRTGTLSDWTPITPPVTYDDFGFSIPVSLDDSQQFFRVILD